MLSVSRQPGYGCVAGPCVIASLKLTAKTKLTSEETLEIDQLKLRKNKQADKDDSKMEPEIHRKSIKV